MRRLFTLLLAAWTTAASASDAPFPRVWSYQKISSNGGKLLAQPPGTDYHDPLNLTYIRDWGRFGFTTTDWSPLNNIIGVARTDVMARAHGYHPAFKSLVYINMENWNTLPTTPVASTDSTMFGSWQNAMLYSNGNPPSSWYYDDAGHGSTPHILSNGFVFSFNYGNPTLVDTLTKIIVRIVGMRDSTGAYMYDGVFFDVVPPPNQSVFGEMANVDLARAGYATAAALDTANMHGILSIFNATRAALGSSRYIFFNPYDTTWARRAAVADGTLLEGTSYCPGLVPGLDGAWTVNTFSVIHQYMTRSWPNIKLISGYSDGTANSNPASATAKQGARFILGASCMGDGWASYGNARAWPTRWYDEYSVDKYGNADTSGASTGWLGNPLGAEVKLDNGLYCREFQNGMVLLDTAATAQTATLPANMYARVRTSGTAVTEFWGPAITSVTVPALDAVFLIRSPALNNTIRKRKRKPRTARR